MEFALKISEDALKDIRQIEQSFQSQNIQLARLFTVQLNETIDYLGTNPKLFETIHGKIRQATVSRFPYHVFYVIDESKMLINIIAVLQANPVNRGA